MKKRERMPGESSPNQNRVKRDESKVQFGQPLVTSTQKSHPAFQKRRGTIPRQLVDAEWRCTQYGRYRSGCQALHKALRQQEL